MGSLIDAAKAALGLDLKPRLTPLNLKLPVISHRVQAQNVLGWSFQAQLQQTQNDAGASFELVKDRIKHLNRCDLSTRQREKLTREVTTLFYPKALQVCTQNTPNQGIPEPAEHKKVLTLAADITHMLMVSNQILFNSYYNSSNFAFARARSQFRQAGLRVFELFHLHQQLKALRYQLPEKGDWLALRTVWLTLKTHDTVEQPQATFKHQLKLETPKSVTQLWINAMLFDHFKPLEWPSHLQWVITSYIKSVPHAAQLVSATVPAPDRRDVITMVPAQVNAAAADAVPGLWLDASVLFKQVRTDCLALIQALRSQKIKDVPSRFAKFKDSDRLIISHKLLHGIDPTEPEAPDDRRDALPSLRLFVGFTEVFALLQHQSGEFAHEERLADALAKRSAVLAQDEHSQTSTLWTLIHETASHIRLSTQESSYTTPMRIGALLAYGLGDAIKKPTLAVVSRIERLGSKTAVIDLDILSRYAEPVVITLNQNLQKVGHRALLMASQNIFWRWGLITEPMDVLPGVDAFSMIRYGQTQALELETLRMATTDFSLFSTKFSHQQLGFASALKLSQASLSQASSPGLTP